MTGAKTAQGMLLAMLEGLDEAKHALKLAHAFACVCARARARPSDSLFGERNDMNLMRRQLALALGQRKVAIKLLRGIVAHSAGFYC